MGTSKKIARPFHKARTQKHQSYKYKLYGAIKGRIQNIKAINTNCIEQLEFASDN